MSDLSPSFGLDDYVAEVRTLIDRDPEIPACVKTIEGLNHRLLESEFVLPEHLRRLDPSAPYTRNLIYQDPDQRFAIIAILWGPFQETRVHDHLNWCVVGVLEKRCLAVEYDRLDDESDPRSAELSVRASYLLEERQVCSLLPPPRTNIHKLSNASREVAITLHTYGDPGSRARVFDPVTGAVEIAELQFHNL